MRIVRYLFIGFLTAALCLTWGLWRSAQRNIEVVVPDWPEVGPLPGWVAAEEDGEAPELRFDVHLVDAHHAADTTNAPGAAYTLPLDPAEAKAWWMAVPARVDVDALRSPTVISRSGQSATCEVGTKVNLGAADGGDFVGAVVHLRGTWDEKAGEVHLDVVAESHEVIGEAVDEFGVTSEWVGIRRVGGNAIIPDGHSALFGGSVVQVPVDISESMPFFSDLPLVGDAFITTQTYLYPKELVVVVTARRVEESP